MNIETEKFFPRLLGQCYKSCRSGIFTIKTDTYIKTIHFDTGDVVYATSNVASERLSDKLLEKNILTQEEIKQANDLSEQYQMRLAEVLIKMNFLSENALKELIKEQILEIIHNSFSWRDFRAEFEYSRPTYFGFKFSLSVPQIILEGVRQFDDLSFIKEMIGDLTSPLQFVDEPHMLPHIVALQPEENKVISYIRSGYTTSQLLDNKAIVEGVGLKTVAALLLSGVIKLGKEQNKNTLFSNSEKYLDTKSVIEFCSQVETKINSIKKGASHYEILEVKTNAPSSDLIASYTRLVKEFHPDRQSALLDYDLNIRKDLDFIFSKLTEAIQVLVENKPQEKQNSYPTKTTNYPTEPFNKNDYGQIMEFCYKVENKFSSIKKGDSYYQILEVDRDATTDVISHAYRRLSEYFSTKKQDNLSDQGINMRNELNEISNALSKAFDTLKDPYKKQQYNQQIGKQLVRNTGTQQLLSSSNLGGQTQSPSSSPSSLLPSDRKNSFQPSSNAKTQLPQVNTPTSNVKENFSPNIPSNSRTANLNEPFDSSRVPKNQNRFDSLQNINNTNSFLRKKADTPSAITKPYTPPAATKPFTPAATTAYIPQPKADSGSLNPTSARTPSGNINRMVEPPPSNPNYIQEKNVKMIENDSVKYQLPKTNYGASDVNRAPTAVDFYVRGTEFYDARQYDKAVTFLRKAVALSPDSGEYWLQLGKVYSRMSGYEKQAEAAYLEAVDLIPEDVEARIGLGLLYQKCGLAESAVEVFEAVLEIDSNNLIAKQALSSAPQSEGKLFNFLAKIGLVNPK